MEAITLPELKVEIEKHEDYKNLTDEQWLAKSALRGLTHRSQKDFDWWEGFYPEKITALREQLRSPLEFEIVVSDDGKVLNSDAERLAAINTKMDRWYYLQMTERRILDKLAAVINEQRLRKDGIVVRTGLHGATPIYIDFDNGNDVNDGETIGNSIQTITQYTTTQARVPGDVGYMRAGITWDQGTDGDGGGSGEDITFDEDGDQDSYISLIGCDSVTNDPWSDASDVNPIVDFESASFHLCVDDLDYWYFEKVDFANCADDYTIYLRDCYHIKFVDCEIENHTTSGGSGVKMLRAEATFDTVTFTDNGRYNITITAGGKLTVKSCIFNGTDSGTECLYGVYNNGSVVYIEDSTFGVTHAHNNNDVYTCVGGRTYTRNCTWNTAITAVNVGEMYSEDDDATFESHITTTVPGSITRGTTDPRAGGSNSFAIMAPGATCGPNNKLVLGHPLSGFARVWVTAGSYTATCYMRATSWGSQPGDTDSNLLLRTSELDTAPARLEATSTDDAVDATWTAFTTTITPSEEGWVYFWVELSGEEDQTEAVEVDLKVTVV